MTENEHYETSDLSLATTLSLFERIEKINNTNPSRVIFCFKNSSKLISMVNSYWSGEVKVNPLAFFNQMKIIKIAYIARHELTC